MKVEQQQRKNVIIWIESWDFEILDTDTIKIQPYLLDYFILILISVTAVWYLLLL